MTHEVGPVTVQGKPMRCNVCSHDLFREHHVQLSNPLFSFLDPDSKAHCAVCERCGFVHMFLPSATVKDDELAPGGAPPLAA